MSIPQISNRKSTGRRRHRIQRRLFGPDLLVLQIEESGLLTRHLGGRIETDSVVRWRDADLTDLTTEQSL